MLLLEDLHWADPASLDLLRTLARQFSALPILLLATYRDDEAAGLDLPETDRACWAAWRDPAALERLLDDPDVYLAEGNILAVGVVPDAGA